VIEQDRRDPPIELAALTSLPHGQSMSNARLARRGAPTTLGPNYRKLWTAAAVSTVGDGVHYAALALLATSLTRDPLKVSAVVFASELPVLLFILPGGALVDRWDRRCLAVCSAGCSACVLHSCSPGSFSCQWRCWPCPL
jgi:MFS family permease